VSALGFFAYHQGLAFSCSL